MQRQRLSHIIILFLLTVAAVLAAGCSGRQPTTLLPLQESTDRVPVVFLPGVTGSRLRHLESGKLLWGRARNVFGPHDGGYNLAIPLDGSPGPQPSEPDGPLLELNLGVIRKPVYRPFLEMMEANGYKAGDLADPAPDETFFFHAYDWRHGVVEAAEELSRHLERLRRARGEETLTVTLISQSNAGLIARYVAKYGGAGLEEAENGAVAPKHIHIDKIILLGTTSGGALRILHELHRGRRYVGSVGRRMQPETLFSFHSLFESLPVYMNDLFVDRDGEPLAVDLYDADNWERYGWSIWSEESRRRIHNKGRSDLFGDVELRRSYLRRHLELAKRLHRLLERDPPGFESPRLYSVQAAFEPTAERAMLVEGADGWETVFPEDARVQDDPYLLSLMVAPGDGHATLESQNWMSPREQAAFGHSPIYVEGRHFEFILNPATERHVLQFLRD